MTGEISKATNAAQWQGLSVSVMVLCSSFAVAMSLLVFCAQPVPRKSILFPCFMHDLIVLAVHWVSLNLRLAADMSGILFFLLRMAVFFFFISQETHKSAAEPCRHLT